MIFIKNTLELIWTIWCISIAGIILIINLPALLIFSFIWRAKEDAFIEVYIRFWANIILIFWGIRMVMIQDQKIDKSDNQ